MCHDVQESGDSRQQARWAGIFDEGPQNLTFFREKSEKFTVVRIFAFVAVSLLILGSFPARAGLFNCEDDYAYPDARPQGEDRWKVSFAHI